MRRPSTTPAALATTLALLAGAGVAAAQAPPPASLAPAAGVGTTEAGEAPGATATPRDADAAFPVRSAVRTAAQRGPDVTVTGSGFGHGVGLSQYGSYAQGLAGRSAAQILGFYYRGTQVVDRPEATRSPIRVGVLPDQTAATPVTAVGGDARWQSCPVVGGSRRCGPLEHDGDPLVQPDGTTWRVGYFADPDGPGSTFAVRTANGRVAPLGAGGRARVRNVDDAGHLRGRVQSTGATVDYFYGIHDVTESGGTFDVVHQVPSIELYMRGLAEVPSSWGVAAPTSLQAQAIAGRTYAVRLHAGGVKSSCDCHILSTPSNQNWTAGLKETSAFGDLWKQAVAATAGELVAYRGELISTFYSSSHAGRSENIEDSWAYGTTPYPYLISVDDPWSLRESVAGTPVNNSKRAWTATVTNGRLARLLGVDRVASVTVRSRTEGGTPREVRVRGQRDGEDVRPTWTRPNGARKPIAGANMRIDLRDVAGDKLPSSQIRTIRLGHFDDDDGSLFEYEASFVAAAGIAEGVAPGRFAAGRRVTRGQMAKFLANTVVLPDGTATFRDVDPDGAFADPISDVASAGIAEGFPDGRFRPGARITRGELASLLARTFALTGGDTGAFRDVDPDGPHAAAIAAVAAAGITDGCGNGRFCPGAGVTRGQMAKFLLEAVDATG